jgi:hypothetical protein
MHRFACIQYLFVFTGNGNTERDCRGLHDPDPGDKRGHGVDS